jgi:hypothetical protein
MASDPSGGCVAEGGGAERAVTADTGKRESARSTDGARTWSATHTVNHDRGLDHSGRRTLLTPFNFVRLPPVSVPPDGVQAGFNGDYTGLTINLDAQARPVWSDTRNRDPFAPTTASPWPRSTSRPAATCPPAEPAHRE